MSKENKNELIHIRIEPSVKKKSEDIFNKLGIKTAYIGTIGYYIDEKIKPLPNTSPDLASLYELFVYYTKYIGMTL